MIRFNIEKLVPLFIMNDQNGYAVAKAIEAAISAMDRVVQDGVDCLLDIEKMPEWRLDEVARETMCPYSNFASVDVKRTMIRDAMDVNRYFGTPGALKKYFEDLIGNTDILESSEYGGYPYHFRVAVEGEWTAEKSALASIIVQNVKNVRSVLDAIMIIFRTSASLGIAADGEFIASYIYPMTCDELLCGTYPY